MATRKKKKTKKPPRLTPTNLWKYRALEAEARAAVSETKRMNLKLEVALEAVPSIMGLYKESLRCQQEARKARNIYREFVENIAAQFQLDAGSIAIDDETGCIKNSTGESNG